MSTKKFLLEEKDIPTAWYNIVADMKNKPLPILNPQTKQPLKEEDLYPLFSKGASHQEMNTTDAWIEIPEEVRELYKVWRPTPLVRAYGLEKMLDTPAHIYFKNESVSPIGSHKLNSAIAQAYYCKQEGITNITTETGAGQWGAALSYAAKAFGLELAVYMVKVSYEQKPFRKAVIHTFGADIIPSPSDTTEVGRAILKAHPGTGGSLGCAISEAIEKAMHTPDCRYVLGSVMNQVLLHQSVIGLESKIAMEKIGEYPDIVIGCAGGGSNLGGLMAAFLQDTLTGKRTGTEFIAVEPASCPSLTRGRYAYDYCDTGHVTPLARMYTLGSEFMPSANHAGGLRYHGMSPILSKLYHDGYMKAVAVEQTKVFEAATFFAKQETILPAPESAHAIRAAMDEAIKCRESGEAKTILFGLTGTGYFDMNAYTAYLEGAMSDYIPTDEDLQVGFDALPKIPGIQ